MSNFFTDNKDLQFALDNFDFQDVVALKENNYKFSKLHPTISQIIKNIIFIRHISF